MMANTHRLLIALLISCVYGAGLEDKKGILGKSPGVLLVPEASPVPYVIYQFISMVEGVSSYRVSGQTEGKISMSTDGWLYLEEPLQWSPGKTHELSIEALSGDDDVLDGPYTVILQVLDINNNPPFFDQSQYSGSVREHMPAGMPVVRVFATDSDDAETLNAHLSYSIESQVPNPSGQYFFTINSENGEISTTEEGAAFLRARTGVVYSRGEIRGSADVLKRKFEEFCSPMNNVPLEENPFFTCVQHAESRQLNANQDPDYTLIVRVQDLGGGAQNSLSSTTRVNIVITQNTWVSPGPISIKENLKADYPMLIATVRSNDPSALYRLVQKEREISFPFTINDHGEIHVTAPLDREQKDMYILVVLAENEERAELDPPMEIPVLVGDENDNAPQCLEDESVLEVQENEVVGSLVGELQVHDADQENTLNSLLEFTLLSQSPSVPSAAMFSVDQARGTIQVANQNFRRSEVPEYRLKIAVSDRSHRTECGVIIRIIDLNNEVPIFEKNDYGRYSVPELAEPGTTLLKIHATDADDPGTGSSRVEYHIAAGDPNRVFAIEVDETTGEGRLYISKPLDYEVQSVYTLQINATNPEPLIKGVEYDSRSTAVVVIEVVDVDEPPVFNVDILNVNVPENLTVGTTILIIDAKDPEGQKIMFKLEGDEQDWLQLDADSGELKTKGTLDRELVETLTVRIIAYETEGQNQAIEKEVSIRLMDVNDNIPKLQQSQGFICVKKPEPLLLTAVDADAPPFAEPFTFTVYAGRKSPNWEITPVDGTSAKLSLKKKPSSDQTFSVPINIKDNAGMGVTQKIEVRVCNCTELGYCYMEPKTHAGKFSVSTTIAILGGVVGFIVVFLIVVVYRTKKEKKSKETADGEASVMLSHHT
ncbi:cadherin-17 [Brachyhypopomus gauderio]|uniref:cadherin-17 n=1 Tax=Brachyhypopomus gauderio TaxID=698409 RepID=UPI0040428EA4